MPAAWSAFTIALNSLHLRSPPLRVVGVAVVRGEEADRVVAPVVAQAALDEVVVVDELVDRHQLDGGDAERREVLDDGRVGEAGVGAAELLGHGRVAQREPADVGLVDDRLVHRVVRRRGRCPSRRTGRRRRRAGRAARCRRCSARSGRRSRRRSTPGPSRSRRRRPWRTGRAAAWPGCTTGPWPGSHGPWTR